MKLAICVTLFLSACGRTQHEPVDGPSVRLDGRPSDGAEALQDADTDASVPIDSVFSADGQAPFDAGPPTDAVVTFDGGQPTLDAGVPQPDAPLSDAGSHSCQISITQAGGDPTHFLITLEVHCTETLVTSSVSVFDGRTLLVQDLTPKTCESINAIAGSLMTAPAQLSAGASFFDSRGLHFSCATH
jgi:hypothetical protein